MKKYISPTNGETNAFTLDSEMYSTQSFWEELVKELSAANPGFNPKTDILKHMRKEFLMLLKNLLKTRLAEISQSSRDTVVNLTTPTKATNLTSANEPSTSHVTKSGSVFDLRTPEQNSTTNEATMQVKVLSKYGYPPDETLEETLDLLLDKSRRHKNSEKRDLMETVFECLYEHHTSHALLTCKECHRHSSYKPGNIFSIPKVGSLPYNLLGRTPKDVQYLSGLREMFKPTNVNAMDSVFKMQLCCWPGNYVTTAMMLLCHTFHHPDVHVFHNYCFYFEEENGRRGLCGTQLIYFYSLVYSLASTTLCSNESGY